MLMVKPVNPSMVYRNRAASFRYQVAAPDAAALIIDKLIRRVTGLDHQHDLARPLEQRDHFFDGVRAESHATLSPPRSELIHLGRGAIVATTAKRVVHVHDEFWPMTASPIRAISAFGSMAVAPA